MLNLVTASLLRDLLRRLNNIGLSYSDICQNPEYAGKPLEPLPPKRNSVKDWAIRRDSVKDINVLSKAPNDYQRGAAIISTLKV